MGGSQSKRTLKEKQKFVDMPLHMKRKQYLVENYTELDKIVPWPLYYQKQLAPNSRSAGPALPIDHVSYRVALWKGDITELEVDAIVNSTDGREGLVHQAIVNTAGPAYKAEYDIEGVGRPGEATVTGGYRLPAKYVINTCPPQFKDKDKLKDCYDNCLEQAKRYGIRSIAFPCIATKKNHGFHKSAAAKIALETVRSWLDRNGNYIELVVFCVFENEDYEQYSKLMPTEQYFPVANVDAWNEPEELPARHINMFHNVSFIG